MLVSNWKRYWLCFAREDNRGKPQTCTPTDASKEQSDSEHTGACGKLKRTRMDHIAEKVYVGSFHCGVVHKPVSDGESMKIPEAKAAVDKEWQNVKRNSSMGRKEGDIQV